MQEAFTSKKYHQAAYVYLANAIFYFFIAAFWMPPHSFGKYTDMLFYIAGGLMAIVFPYLIYKEYRKFTIFLAGIYLIRTIASLLVIPFYSSIIMVVFFIHTLTFYMLVRAAWNLRP